MLLWGAQERNILVKYFYRVHSCQCYWRCTSRFLPWIKEITCRPRSNCEEVALSCMRASVKVDHVLHWKRKRHSEHDDVIKGKCFPRYWPFVSGIHRWILLTKASDAELWCFLWSAPELTVVQTLETLVIWDAIALIMTSLQWEMLITCCTWSFHWNGNVILMKFSSLAALELVILMIWPHENKTQLSRAHAF